MPHDKPHLSWASERHLRIVAGTDISPATHAIVRAVARAFESDSFREMGVLDVVPAYASVLLTIDLPKLVREGAKKIEHAVRQALEHAIAAAESRAHGFEGDSKVLEVPACYAREFAPDLADVAKVLGLSEREVIERHAAREYFVHFVGFSPGFAYLGGLDPAIDTPRLAKPRLRVPAGSIALAGGQTAVYPTSTPGGWRLIGRTPWRMFDPRREPASRLKLGDRVRFIPIDEQTFARIANQQAEMDLKLTNAASVPHSENTPRGLIRVIDPGMFTTVQDLGRHGHAAAGVPESGAADIDALRRGNRLLGNSDHAAALEMTLRGGEFECASDTRVCVTGAPMPLSIHTAEGDHRESSHDALIHVHARDRLQIGVAPSMARAYLCVEGGIDAPLRLGSRATLVHAGFGGLDGRALKAGDLLQCGLCHRANECDESMTHAHVPAFISKTSTSPTHCSVRVVDGAHAELFSADARATFFASQHLVASNSDRMGIRLQGPAIFPPGGGRLLSEGMMWGAIQITESGQPIVLMPDHPTTGGYPVVACVITSDLSKLGQLRPGDKVRFDPVTLDEARAAWEEAQRVIGV